MKVTIALVILNLIATCLNPFWKGKLETKIETKLIPKKEVESKWVKPRKVAGVDYDIVLEYTLRFYETAVKEEEKYGIPREIKLAQAILETKAGTSRLVKKCKNHFGYKCFSKNCKKGHCHNFTDDTHKDFFRSYKTDWESFRAHSKLICGDRYKWMIDRYNIRDYKAWAYGLKKSGYATDKKYPEKIISIVESMDLQNIEKWESLQV